ncbi:hypothetical protein HPB51_000401 [Rhipicephalus microplus]|uniref:Uncharacterized protein n=1 Tax=Rhipicephalus microplus TaxID=6941 RepID=A0A9J6EF81_RHIMP|nr:hypothetical protein HPB51_000401 [Rhipicephalus microplus]
MTHANQFLVLLHRQTVKSGDSVPQLLFQGYTSGYWEGDFWTRSMMTEGAKESSTQTEPLTISSDGVRLNENAAFANTHFITSVCEGKMLTIHAQRLVLHNRKQRPKLDGFELLHDLFENEPSVSVVHEQVVNITATTTGMQVVGTQDPAQPKYHLDEVTGKNDVLSRIVYELRWLDQRDLGPCFRAFGDHPGVAVPLAGSGQHSTICAGLKCCSPQLRCGSSLTGVPHLGQGTARYQWVHSS